MCIKKTTTKNLTNRISERHKSITDKIDTQKKKKKRSTNHAVYVLIILIIIE